MSRITIDFSSANQLSDVAGELKVNGFNSYALVPVGAVSSFQDNFNASVAGSTLTSMEEVNFQIQQEVDAVYNFIPANYYSKTDLSSDGTYINGDLISESSVSQYTGSFTTKTAAGSVYTLAAKASWTNPETGEVSQIATGINLGAMVDGAGTDSSFFDIYANNFRIFGAAQDWDETTGELIPGSYSTQAQLDAHGQPIPVFAIRTDPDTGVPATYFNGKVTFSNVEGVDPLLKDVEDNKSDLADISSDSVVTPDEKALAHRTWYEVYYGTDGTDGSYPLLTADAVNEGVDSTTLTDAYDALDLYLNTTLDVFLNLGESTIIDRAEWDVAWNTYYAEALKVNKAINASLKVRADNAAQAAASAASIASQVATDNNLVETSLNAILDENFVTPDEQRALNVLWDKIKYEYQPNINAAGEANAVYEHDVNVSTSSYSTAYTNLSSYLNGYPFYADSHADMSIGQDGYDVTYSERVELENRIRTYHNEEGLLWEGISRIYKEGVNNIREQWGAGSNYTEINGEVIKTGKIQSTSNPNTYLDLNSGDFKLGSKFFFDYSTGSLTIGGDITSGSTISGSAITGGTITGGAISGGTISGAVMTAGKLSALQQFNTDSTKTGGSGHTYSGFTSMSGTGTYSAYSNYYHGYNYSSGTGHLVSRVISSGSSLSVYAAIDHASSAVLTNSIQYQINGGSWVTMTSQAGAARGMTLFASFSASSIPSTGYVKFRAVSNGENNGGRVSISVTMIN